MCICIIAVKSIDYPPEQLFYFIIKIKKKERIHSFVFNYFSYFNCLCQIISLHHNRKNSNKNMESVRPVHITFPKLFLDIVDSRYNNPDMYEMEAFLLIHGISICLQRWLKPAEPTLSPSARMNLKMATTNQLMVCLQDMENYLNRQNFLAEDLADAQEFIQSVYYLIQK